VIIITEKKQKGSVIFKSKKIQLVGNPNQLNLLKINFCPQAAYIISKEMIICNAETIRRNLPPTPATNAVAGCAMNVSWIFKEGSFAGDVLWKFLRLTEPRHHPKP